MKGTLPSLKRALNLNLDLSFCIIQKIDSKQDLFLDPGRLHLVVTRAAVLSPLQITLMTSAQ